MTFRELRIFQLGLYCTIIVAVSCFPNLRPAQNFPPRKFRLHAVRIEGYDDAFSIIDKCAVSGTPSDDLYDAVRFIDRNSIKIYPDESEKKALWKEAEGSWKLKFASGKGKTTFQTVPIFAFAMIDETNFGNGIGIDENTILLSLLGPHIFNAKRRQMTIVIEKMFLGGKDVTNFVPDFIAEGVGLGKQPEDFNRPPTFTWIGASEFSLIARGATGGIAIWTRLPQDIRPVAYVTK